MRQSRFRSDGRGSAATEFALLMPVVLLILLGAADFGFSMRTQMMLHSAVNMGLQHAMVTQGSAVTQTEAVIAHALEAMPATVSVERFCQCGSTKVACTAPCGSAKDSFVSARVSVLSTHLLWPDVTLSSHMRVFTGKVT